MSDNVSLTCTKCGQCIRACVNNAISFWDDGVRIDLDKCIKCGHCVSVCPTDEMENPLSPRQPLMGELPSPEDMERYLRIPRSIRNFKKELPEKETLARLINIGRYPQTGSNLQGISYAVVSGRDKIKRLNELFCGIVDKYNDCSETFAWLRSIADLQRQKSIDIVFRGCSQLLLALSEKSNERGGQNAQFSLTYIALLAPTMGIGTCWAGIFERLATNDKYNGALLEELSIPSNKTIRGAMMIGLPDVKYRRLVERDPLDITWI